MSPPSSQIRLRKARKDDVPTLVTTLLEAFRGRAMNEAFFPARLRGQEGDTDQIRFRTDRMLTRFLARDEIDQDPSNKRQPYHYLVAVEDDTNGGGGGSGGGDGEGLIVGYAEWVDHAAIAWNNSLLTEAQRAEKKEREARLQAEITAKRPPSLDGKAVDEAFEKTKVLESFLKETLGEEGFVNSWCLDAIGVDPAHQRKGIGKMLMQYGAERAEKDGKNVRFMASMAGAKMYRALGYEEVGSYEILGGMEYSFVRRARQ